MSVAAGIANDPRIFPAQGLGTTHVLRRVPSPSSAINSCSDRIQPTPIMVYQQHHAWYVFPVWVHITSANALIIKMLEENPALVVTY